eukprot:XP_019928562.1 PREDICTED: uncharacterized protein LOC105342368 [Crassostrea gigas]
MSCYIPDYCTGIECCAEIPGLGLGLHLYLNLDLDKLELSFGFENMQKKMKLIDYVWGDEIKVSVAEGLIKFTFSIKPITDENVYVFNARAMVCLDGGKCSINIPVLTNTKLPSIRALITGDFNFSMSNWLENMGIPSLGDLKDSAKTMLIQQLGVDKFLQDRPCDINDDLYSPSVNGWKNECPLNWVVPPTIPFRDVKCALTQNCTRIDCCVDFSLLNLRLHFFLHFDRCNYVISGGIEKKTFSYGLLDFNTFWGKEIKTDIVNIIFIKFKASQLEVSRKYVLDLGISVCLEPNKCELDVPIFKEVLIPILNCDLKMDFSSKGFSLSNWMSEQGLSLEGSLSTALSDSLFKLLGIDSFIKEKSCSRSEPPYSINQLQENGWSSECPTKLSLFKIRGTTACNIKESCTAVSCCVEVGKLGRTFEVVLDIDFCNQKITFGIEKLTETLSLQMFEFGVRKEIVIRGVIKFGYTIWDYVGEGVYVVTVDLAVCLEDGGDCLISVNILDQAKLSKQICHWGTGFMNPEFTLGNFMKKNALTAFNQIKGLVLDELKESLGLPQYLNNPPCSLSNQKYNPNINGIKNTCPKSIGFLPSLPSSMRCAIAGSCTGVDCCIEAAPIHHNLHVYLDIDPCNLQMKFGIDKFQFQIYLKEFEFGIEKDVRLVNVVRMKFKIWDLTAENQYLIDLKFSVCFDSESQCLLDVPVFHQQRLPKNICDFTASFTNFSLDGWKSSMGLTSDKLTTFATDQLMEYLGIAGYLKKNQCSIQNGNSTIQGWNDDCSKSSTYQKTSLLALPILCSISSKCTEIYCCLAVSSIGRNFEAFIDLDPCYKTLELGIEEYRTRISLLNYSFGATNSFWMKDVVRIEYTIEELEVKYLVNMKVEVCLEHGKPCLISYDIAKNLYLPKIGCDWSFNYSGFSLSGWYSNMSLTPGSLLSNTYLSMLKEKLGITNFLLPKEQQCNRNSAKYYPQTLNQNRWRIDCPLDVGNMTELSDVLPISCHLMSHCTGVECCLDLHDPLQQTIYFFLDLDFCLQTLRVGVETLVYEKTLFSYQYGVKDEFSLMDIIQIQYKIDDVDRSNLELTAKIKICLEENTCLYESTLFDKHILPKPGCNWNLNFTIPDFSLTNWYNSVGAAIGSQLSKLNAAKLLEQLGIAKYKQEVPCQRFGPVYSPSDIGWKKDCQMEVEMAPISDSVTCLVKDTCTSVSCCVDIGFMKTSFEAYLTLDACNYWLDIGIEKLTFNLSLKDVTFGLFFL